MPDLQDAAAPDAGAPDPVADEIPESFTLTLRKPATHKGSVVTELRLREPLVGELRKSDEAGDGLVSNVALVALVAGISRQLAEEIGTRDQDAAIEYLTLFIAHGGLADPAVAREDLLDELTIPLRKPVKLGNRDVTELALCEPKSGQLIRSGRAGTAIKNSIMLIASVTGLPPATIEAIGIRDFNAAVRYLNPFIAGDQTAGKP